MAGYKDEFGHLKPNGGVTYFGKFIQRKFSIVKWVWLICFDLYLFVLIETIPILATVKESRARENLTHGLIERTEVVRPLSTLLGRRIGRLRFLAKIPDALHKLSFKHDCS